MLGVNPWFMKPTPKASMNDKPRTKPLAFLANAIKPKAKFASVIGSYGWGGKAVEQIAAMIPNLKVEILEPVVIKGYPKEADFQALDKLADTIVAKHKQAGLV